jgi:MSHA pilin protein MshC
MRTLLQFTKRPLIQGFTMVELIMVMVILGILSAIALPRFTGRVDFDARGFFDQTQNMIRYAQKTAIAQRRPVWVQINQTPSVICLTYAAVSVNCSSDGGAPVLAPNEQNWFVRTAPADVSFGSSPQFSFNALGQPSSGLVLTLYRNGSTSIGQIRVEAETGYVH